MHDRAVAGGGLLSSAAAILPVMGERTVELPATHERAARKATLSLRFCQVEVLRPDGPDAKDLPKSVSLRLVEVVERNPPEGVEPLHWRPPHHARHRRCGGGLADRHVSRGTSKAKLGTVIVSGAAKTGANEWKGNLLSPEDGRTYSGVITLVGADGLNLKGCALGVFCEGETWRRVQ